MSDRPRLDTTGYKYGIDTNIIAPDIIEQRIDLGGGIIHRVLNTAEEQARQRLIELGWTPPKAAGSRDPYDMIAEALWRLHVPEARERNWTWGADISRYYAEKYREAARAMVPSPIILP